MNDLFVIDAAHPIAASLRLACSEPRDAVQGYWDDVGRWLPDGPEYLILLATLWHVCSLLQPDLFQHVMIVNATHRPSLLSLSSGGTASTSDVCERPASAWPSHPMHVVVLDLTSPRVGPTQGDPPRVRACDAHSVFASTIDDGYPKANTGLTATRGCMQDAGGGGGGGECMAIAWLSGPDAVLTSTDDGGDRACGPDLEWTQDVLWDVHPWTWTGGRNGPTRVRTDGATRIPQKVWDAARREECGYGHGYGLSPVISMVSNVLGRAHPVDTLRRGYRARSGSWEQTTTVLRDPHEAHGVGMIVKALVQQNASASLFLRTIVCVAALLCCVHSIFVLGVGGEHRNGRNLNVI